MIDLKPKRASLPMELMCALPCEPMRSPIDMLADELDAKPSSIRLAAASLQKKGVRVVTDGTSIAIAREDFLEARQQGENYWIDAWNE